MQTAKILLLLVLAFAASASTALAGEKEEWPTKPVEIYMGYPPGGATDMVARVYAPIMSKELGVPVVLMYKPGAAGALCAEYIAGVKPDGYIIQEGSYNVIATRPHTVKTTMKPSDFTFILSHCTSNFAFVIRNDAPWRNFKEWVEAARVKPGSTYGTNGAYSNGHIIMEWIVRREGVKGVHHVPFSGGGEVFAPVLGGHIDMGWGAGQHLPLVEAGKLRVLLQLNGERDPKIQYITDLYPDLPEPLKLTIDCPSGLTGPKGMPAPIVQKLSNALKKAIDDEGFRRLMKENKRVLVQWEGEDAFKKVQMISDAYPAFLKQLGFVLKK